MSGEIQSLQVLDGAGFRIAIARSRFNDKITSGLAEGAIEYLRATRADFEVFDAPGAFELPLVSSHLLRSGFDGVVALGAVIEGDTDHYEHVATSATKGLMQVMLEEGKPVAFGVLTVKQEGQALARCQPGPGNKGAEAAAAVIETALLLRRLAD